MSCPDFRLKEFHRKVSPEIIKFGTTSIMQPVLLQAALFLLFWRSSFAIEKSIVLEDIGDTPTTLSAEIGTDDHVTWWLPDNADAYVLPISGGIEVQASNHALVKMLRERSPWSLTTLPAVGARYGNLMIVVIIPWPHYAELVVSDKLGIRYAFPSGRKTASPCEVVVVKTTADSLNVSRTFRKWRSTATKIGAIPRRRSRTEKFEGLPKAERLLGAPHIYLWGPGHFSLHDVPRAKWKAFANELNNAAEGSFAQR
jgi:hypothetical protein